MKQYEIEVVAVTTEKSKFWVSSPNKRLAESFVRCISGDRSLTDEMLKHITVDQDDSGSVREKVVVKTVATYSLPKG